MTFHIPRRLRLPSIVAVLTAAALLLAACGSDGSTSASSSATGKGNSTDLAFVNEMIPHHRSAVSMAKIAQQRGAHAEIKTLADAIVKSQSAEITKMDTLAAGFKADGVKAGDLGIDAAMMGMSMDDSSLKTANPFDRAFIDMMVSHHQGAIRMARVELAKGASAETKQLAQAIIDAQTKEIGEMNGWRKSWFGAMSPAGGVPAAGDAGDAMSSGGHGSTHDG